MSFRFACKLVYLIITVWGLLVCVILLIYFGWVVC